MSESLNISKPSLKEVEHYIEIWENTPEYFLPENSLERLFAVTYPLNNDLNDVLIKVCSLKSLYGLVIYSPLTVAEHIVALKIDDAFLKKDLSIVNKIANVKMKNGQNINFYSFATKYCSHHKPEFYPIYDSYVENVLKYFRRKDKFAKFLNKDLKLYTKYNEILIDFKKYYDLESFDLKQMDKYLWQVGKEYFPKQYGKKIKRDKSLEEI